VLHVRVADLALSFEGPFLLARSQSVGKAARLPPPAVAVLSFCAEPRSRAEVVAQLGTPLAGLYDGLVEAGLLVPPDKVRHTAAFFHNFAGIEIHRRMLGDTARVAAYARAISATVKPGMAVLDAGTGTGLLALLAARAGARVVYAVDNSDLLPLADEVARASGLDGVVKTLRGDFAQVRLPEPVDVIITETFGAFALAEGSVPDLAACVAHNLKPGGKVVPNGVVLRIAPVEGRDLWQETQAAFEDRLGLLFGPLRQAASARGRVTDVPADALAAPPATLARLQYPSADAPSGQVEFAFQAQEWCGFAAWFDVLLDDELMLGTGPDAPPTHWRQVFLPVPPQPAPSGALRVSMRLEPSADDRRSLDVIASWPGGGARWRVR
jgi:SAM-dependent methyltransferase